MARRYASRVWWRAAFRHASGISLALAWLVVASCSDPQADALKQLTAKGYSLSTAEFFKAARAGDAPALQWFIAAGISPGVKDSRGRFALNEAVTNGHLPAVEVLIRHGANMPPDRVDSLLGDAVRSHKVAVLHALLEAGIRPSADVLASPLVVAAQERQREMIDLLAPWCETHVNAALITAAETGDVAVLSALLKHGAPVIVRDQATDRTPLLLASARGHGSAVEMLLASGSDRLAVDGAGRSALDLAREGQHQAVVAQLGKELTPDELMRPAKLNGQMIKLGGTVPVSPDSQWVLLGCYEETIPWELLGLGEGTATLRVSEGGAETTLGIGAVVSGTDWMLKSVQPVGLFARPGALFRDRETWKHLLLVQGVPARRGRLCAWLQFVPDRTVYETGEGDRFSVTGEQMIPIVVKKVSTMEVILANEADTSQSWTLQPGGVR